MSLPKILVAYKDSDCGKDLAKFYNSVKLAIGDHSGNLNIEEEVKEGAEYDIHISTKYYDADVQMVFYKYNLENYEDIIKSVEGLSASIFYFKSPDKLDDFMMFVIEMLNNASSEVNLLVHDSPDGFLSHEHETGINQLCEDYFMELVLINSLSLAEKQAEGEHGILGDGKEGIDRVAEALQCNMWTNMIRKPMDIKPQSQQIKEENKETDNNRELEQREDEENKEYEEIKDQEGEQDNTTQSEQQKVILEDKASTLIQIPDYSQTQSDPNILEFEKEERNLEELGSLMSQIKNLKSSIENMTMEERRKNAEDMIRKIAGFMNLDDDVDFSDDEIDEQEGNS